MSSNTEPKIISRVLSAEELTTPSIPVLCDDCDQSFINTGNLFLHMLKHHNVDIRNSQSSKVVTRYFCPEKECKYNKDSQQTERYFTTKKYLKQHYMKVHATKTFHCSREQCDKVFSCLRFKTAHEAVCGQNLVCIECGWSYKSREALLTHCKRKKHQYKKPNENTQQKEKFVQLKEQPSKWRKIAPKSISSIDKATDTTDTLAKRSQTTQTVRTDQQRDKKFLNLWNKLVKEPTKVKKSHKSKIKPIETEQIADKSYRNLDIFDSETSTLMTNSSYAQTDKNLNNLNYVEDDSLPYFSSENFNAGLCHIETQTEFQLFQENIAETNNNDQLDQLLYSNMHTQTCDEILTEFCLANIQTQTDWSASDYSDLLKSTETQTYSTFTLGNSSSIQTQTNSLDKA